MSNFVLTQSNVTSIGTAENKKESRAADVVAFVGEAFDWTARGAVAEAIRQAGGWTKETCPARKSGGKDNPTVTVFGKGFSALESAVTALVKSPKEAEAGVLRFSLSGEGGATVTIKPGAENYEAALTFYNSLTTDEA